jgi:hypothetical protein
MYCFCHGKHNKNQIIRVNVKRKLEREFGIGIGMEFKK